MPDDRMFSTTSRIEAAYKAIKFYLSNFFHQNKAKIDFSH